MSLFLVCLLESLICSNTSLARCNLQTCKAVKKLVADGCYDKCVFYRAEPGFVVQGGLKRSDGAKVKSPIKSIPLEVSRPNVRGSLTMARWEEPTSGSGEFFIVIADEAPHLDKTGDSGERCCVFALWLGSARSHAWQKGWALGFCCFGEVVEGIEVADEISELDTTTKGGLSMLDEPVQFEATIEAAE